MFDVGLRDSSRVTNAFNDAVAKTDDSLEECADYRALVVGVWGLRSELWSLASGVLI